MHIAKAFPFTLVTLIIYNILILGLRIPLDQTMLSLTLPSGDEWRMPLDHLIIIAAIILLFLDLLSATSSQASSIINHGLSLIVFLIGLFEFIFVNGCGTSTFFVILVIAVIDVVAGFTITIMVARRDLAVGAPAASAEG